MAEAHAKRRGHVLQTRRLNRSLSTETASNCSYFALAGLYYLSTQHTLELKGAFIGAVGVSAALLYKRAKAQHKIKSIKSSVETYEETGRTSAFDHLGITFRGNRPLNTDDTHEPFHIFHNPFYLPNSIGRAIDCTWSDVVMRPSSLAYTALKNVFGKQTRLDDVEFHYANDACCEENGVVMQTTLEHLNNDAVVQMPASEERLLVSQDYTHRTIWKSLYSDYAELLVNLGGALGAAEFCISVGKVAAESGMHAYSSGDAGGAAFAAASCVTMYIGTDPLQNFLDDTESIHERLNAKFEILRVKKAAMAKIRETVADIKLKIAECAYIDVGIIDRDIEEHQRGIQAMFGTIDVRSLPDDTKTHLKHRDIALEAHFEALPA